MQKEINKLSESTLWLMLGDISVLMTERRHPDHNEITDYWLTLSDAVKTELDKRLLKGGYDEK